MRSHAAMHQTSRGSVRRSQVPSLKTWRFGYARMRASAMRMWRLSHLNCTYYKVRYRIQVYARVTTIPLTLNTAICVRKYLTIFAKVLSIVVLHVKMCRYI